MENDVFKERKTYMYLAGGKRWVANNLALVLFKHHWLNRCLHKVTYVNFSYNTKKMRHINGGNKEKDTCMYKKQYKQEFQYINIPGGLEEVCNQWIDSLATREEDF